MYLLLGSCRCCSSLRIVSGKRPESTQVRPKLTALRHQLLRVNVSPGCRRIYATTPPGMLNSQASNIIGPLFASKGWVFFMPYRRGQGLSLNAGPYIIDEIKVAQKRGGIQEASETMTRLLSTEQLEDQLSAFAWLRTQAFVQQNRIAVAGNSFGGVETVLGAAKLPYCAAVVASGGAESWDESPELQQAMKAAARMANSPMLFFQAANDFNLAPSEVLSSERKKAGKPGEVKTYPAFGKSASEGHSFAYRGSGIWFPDIYEFIDKHCI